MIPCSHLSNDAVVLFGVGDVRANCEKALTLRILCSCLHRLIRVFNLLEGSMYPLRYISMPRPTFSESAQQSQHWLPSEPAA